MPRSASDRRPRRLRVWQSGGAVRIAPPVCETASGEGGASTSATASLVSATLRRCPSPQPSPLSTGERERIPREKKIMPIEFYSTKDTYGCFSNFSAHGFTLDGKWWPTSEHYFQAQKFAGTEYAEEVRKANSPMIAARLGRRARSAPARLGERQGRRDAQGGAGEVRPRTPTCASCSWARARRSWWRRPPTTTTGAAAPTGPARTGWARSPMEVRATLRSRADEASRAG